jgi:hypothetical protein
MSSDGSKVGATGRDDGVARWLDVTRSLGAGSPPTSGATPQRIAEVEAGLGLVLDDAHRRLLLAQDGWEPTGRTAALAGPLRVAGVDLLLQAPGAGLGPQLDGFAGPADLQGLRDAGVSPGAYLVAAVDPAFGGSYVMPVRAGRAGPEVVTVAGWVEESLFVGEVYPSFADFLGRQADRATKHAEDVLARESRQEQARQHWQAEPTLTIRGLPDDIATLADGIVRLVARVGAVGPVTGWQVARRAWDGGAAGLVAAMTQKTFLTLEGHLATGGRWQVSVTRHAPRSPDDKVLVLLVSSNPVEQPTADQVDALVAGAVRDLGPATVVASSMTANRTAADLEVPQPSGYRIWLRRDQLGRAAREVDTGSFVVTDVEDGVLLSAPDHWSPEQVLPRAHVLVTRMTDR